MSLHRDWMNQTPSTQHGAWHEGRLLSWSPWMQKGPHKILGSSHLLLWLWCGLWGTGTTQPTFKGWGIEETWILWHKQLSVRFIIQEDKFSDPRWEMLALKFWDKNPFCQALLKAGVWSALRAGGEGGVVREVGWRSGLLLVFPGSGQLESKSWPKATHSLPVGPASLRPASSSRPFLCPAPLLWLRVVSLLPSPSFKKTPPFCLKKKKVIQ